jgi:hypothetical protein
MASSFSKFPMTNDQCQMNVCLRQLLFKLFIPSFVIFNLSFVIIQGCGDISGSLGGIEVSPTKVTVGINQPQQFSALGRSSGGFLIATNPTWSIQGPIGTITLSGLLRTGSLEATGKVIATDGTLTGSAVVTITKKGWLEGNVTDTNGSILNGIRVYLAEIPTLGDETDASGNYKIADIPAGTYEAVINPFPPTSGDSFEVTIGEGETATWSPKLSTPTTTITVTTLPF